MDLWERATAIFLAVLTAGATVVGSAWALLRWITARRDRAERIDDEREHRVDERFDELAKKVDEGFASIHRENGDRDRRVAELERHLAKDYVPRPEISVRLDRLHDKIDRISEKLGVRQMN